jgi:CHAT domain-containing protein
VVHLAVHGEFGYEQDETRLLLPASGEVTFNSLRNIFGSRQRQPIELLVLSACETAEGSDRDVLGIAGMTVQTGSNSTLATLWSVNDLSTAELMKEFYGQLKDPDISKAEALRRAQLHLLRDFPGRYNPSDWSPYVLVGDWR